MEFRMTDHPVVQNAVPLAPAAALVGSQILGLSLPDWAAIFGIAFIVIQGAYLLWKWRREWRARPPPSP